MKIARFVLLVVLAAALLAAADFGYNYFQAISALPGGSNAGGLLPRLVFMGGSWQLRDFFLGFAIAGGLTVLLAVANIVLACIHILRGDRVLF